MFTIVNAVFLPAALSGLAIVVSPAALETSDRHSDASDRRDAQAAAHAVGRSEKAPAEVTEREHKEFEGKWEFVAYEVSDGQKFVPASVVEIARVKLARAAQQEGRGSPEKVHEVFLVFDANGRWSWRTEDGVLIEEGSSEIDPTKVERRVDMTGAVRSVPQLQTRQGIYQFPTDNTCTICLAAPGKERPRDFTGNRAAGTVLMRLQRVKSK